MTKVASLRHGVPANRVSALSCSLAPEALGRPRAERDQAFVTSYLPRMFEALNEFEHGIDFLEHALGETDLAVATIAAVGRVSIEMRDWVGRKNTPVNSASLAEAGEAGTQLQSGIARLADVASRLTAQIGDFLAEVKAA